MMKKHLSICIIVLTVLFFSHRIHSQEKDRSEAATKQDDFVTLSRDKVMKEYNLKPLDSSQELERIILEEIQKLDRVANFSTAVWKTDRATFAHPEVGIAVNLEELKEFARRGNIQQLRQYISFILAHEKTHQIQFLRYPDFKYSMSDVREKRLYECQADIFAGKLLIETQKLTGQKDNDKVIKESITDALQVAFLMGSEQFSDDTSHPSHEERRTAVRLGMTAGLLVVFQQVEGLNQKDPVLVQQLLSEKLNMFSGEDLISWSLRSAKRIIHYNRDASKDIVLSTHDLKWDENSSNPFVSYNYVYKNTGLRTIEIDMEFQCNWVSREKPNDTLLWQRWTERNYKFKLAPGEQFTANGTLPWGNPSGEGLGDIDPTKLMPKFIAPLDDPRALVSFEFADSAKLQGEIESLKLALNKLINNSSNNFKQYRAEAGRKLDDNIIYPSSLTIPDSVDQTSIVVPKDTEAYVEAILYKGNDNTAALRIYNQTTVKLKAIFQENNVGEERRRSLSNFERRYYEFEPRENNEAKINLSFIKRNSNNKYLIRLTVTAPEISEEKPSEDQSVPEIKELGTDYKNIASQFLENLVKTNYEEASKNFGSYAKQFLDTQHLAESWANLIQNIGAFKSKDDIFLSKEQKYDAVVIKCKMERANVFVVVIFDEKGLINGLAFRPAPIEITEKQSLAYKAITQQVLNDLLKKDFNNIYKRFHPQTAANLSVERLSQLWESTIKKTGSFTSNEEPTTGIENGFYIVYIKCRMEQANLMLVISFDSTQQIRTFWIAPSF